MYVTSGKTTSHTGSSFQHPFHSLSPHSQSPAGNNWGQQKETILIVYKLPTETILFVYKLPTETILIVYKLPTETILITYKSIIRSLFVHGAPIRFKLSSLQIIADDNLVLTSSLIAILILFENRSVSCLLGHFISYRNI